MSGGSIGKVKVITTEDFKKAEEELRAKLVESAKEEFTKKLPEGFVLRDEALHEEIGELSYTHIAGDVADSFKVSGSMTIQALLFSEVDVRDVVRTTISRYVSDNLLYSDNISQIEYSNIKGNFETEVLLLSIHVEERLARNIDTEEIRNELKGLNEIEVRRYFGQRDDIDTARVVFFPRFLVRKVPNDITKIEVIIEDSEE